MKKTGPAPLVSTLLVSLLVSACVGMPISSMLKLRNMEPLEMDPASLSIAVITDKVVQMSNGSTSLTLGFSSEQSAFDFSNKSEASIVSNAEVLELQGEKQTYQNITLFYLDQDAAAIMRDAQTKIRDIQNRGIKGEGSLTIGIESGCFTGPIPEVLEASIYVKFDPEQGYIMMNSGIDLLTVSSEQQLQDLWPQCKT